MKFDIQNPRSIALKKFMFDVLKNKYPEYEELTERMSSCLITEKDLMTYSKMISDIYELGYLKAVEDYKTQLADLGIKVTVAKKTQG